MNCFVIYIKLVHVFDGCSPLNDERACIYRKLLHNWHQPYQIITKLSPVSTSNYKQKQTVQSVQPSIMKSHTTTKMTDPLGYLITTPTNHTCLTIYCRHQRRVVYCRHQRRATINCWTHAQTTTTKHPNIEPTVVPKRTQHHGYGHWQANSSPDTDAAL